MSPSIVIVDDSRAIQAILSRTIRAVGFQDPQVHTFSAAEDALAFVDQNGADLVITDWHMPGMSGLELLQSVRQLAGRTIQVGMVTTESAEDLLGQATRSGAAFILRKPFKDDALHDAVKTALKASHPTVRQEPSTQEPTPPIPVHATASTTSSSGAATPPAVVPPARPGFHRESLREELEQALQKHFGSIKLRLVEVEQPSLELFTSKNLLALYSQASGRGVVSLALLDTTVMLMLMGAATLAKPEVIRPLIASSATDASTVEHCRRFLLASSAVLVTATEGHPAGSQVQCSMVPRTLTKLQDSFSRLDRLRAFKLQVPGYGEGHLAFFLP